MVVPAGDVTISLSTIGCSPKYSIDGDSTGGGWVSASSAGSDGAMSHQTITAGSVPFNRDSGTQNKIKFKIDDFVGIPVKVMSMR